MNRWQRYWFADGGRQTAAILRIAIAIAVWLTLDRLRDTWPANAPGGPLPAEVYRPVGVWMIFGHAPSTGLIEALWVVARLGTVAMLFGAASRAATAVSFAAAMSIAALSYAGTQSWSHQYNIVFLAQAAFLGARGGDTWSIDALVRKLRRLPQADIARGYQWSIRLVQLAVALMFVSGMFHKVLHGHMTLRWALSDNLRHHLLVRYDLAGVPRPPIVDWILDEAWRYRTVAVLNLVSQTIPLGACFLLRRPWLRAACGMFFVIETVALGVVMQLWNLHWLPLAAVFVDWEVLIAWVSRRSRPTPPAVAVAWKPPRPAQIFVIAFVAYDIITAFVPGLDQRLNTYPFSGFPMFATIRARQPYSEHLPYSVTGGHLELIGDAGVNEETYRWIDYTYRTTYTVRDPDELQKRLAGILADVLPRYPQVHTVRLWLTVFEAPAYPAPAGFERHPIAIIAEYHADRSLRTLLGSAREANHRVVVTPVPRGVDGERSLAYILDDLPDPVDVAGWDLAPPSGGQYYFFARVRDGAATTPWLVAYYRRK